MTHDGHKAGVVKYKSKHKAPASERNAMQVLIVRLGFMVPIVHDKVVGDIISGDYQTKGLKRKTRVSHKWEGLQGLPGQIHRGLCS